jgi:hypothetical protein
MPKGWTVELTTHDETSWRRIVRHRLFDVAIEDRGRAVEAVRHHAQANSDANIVAIEEIPRSSGLSPGRIRPR